jgi:hypothetical protein
MVVFSMGAMDCVRTKSLKTDLGFWSGTCPDYICIELRGDSSFKKTTIQNHKAANIHNMSIFFIEQ